MIISVIVIHLKNTPAALPLLALAVADKAEVAHSTTLTEGLGTDEVGVRQRAIVDDVSVADVFGTVRTGGSGRNPYNPSVSESTTESRYLSFGLTWRIGRTEMEAQQTHGKKESKKKRMANNQ